jgi:hypothetical protein
MPAPVRVACDAPPLGFFSAPPQGQKRMKVCAPLESSIGLKRVCVLALFSRNGREQHNVLLCVTFEAVCGFIGPRVLCPKRRCAAPPPPSLAAAVAAAGAFCSSRRAPNTD